MVDTLADSAIALPRPVLRPYVDRYVGYRLEGFPPGIHRGLPSGHLTFIISLTEPVDIVELPDRSRPPASWTAFVGGLHDVPATISHDGNQHGIAVDLTPLGARAVLGMPAGALAFDCVELGDVLGRAAVELEERLREVTTWAEQFAVLDDVLGRVLVEAKPPPPELACAWHLLRAGHGAVDIASIAGEVGWSRRHLADRFRAELGLSPKTVARVLRFDRARRLLGNAPHRSLAELAAVCGYYDQAHLNRDWRQLAGCSPTAWLAEDLPSFQDTAVADEGG